MTASLYHHRQCKLSFSWFYSYVILRSLSLGPPPGRHQAIRSIYGRFPILTHNTHWYQSMCTRLQKVEAWDSRVTTFSFLSVVHVRHIGVVKSLPPDFNLPPLPPKSASTPAAEPTNIFHKAFLLLNSWKDLCACPSPVEQYCSPPSRELWSRLYYYLLSQGY